MIGLNRKTGFDHLCTLLLLTVSWAAGVDVVFARDAAPPKLRYVAIISRHGVRSPTWTNERLNQYSSDPWPDWGVPPGNLTPHGRVLMRYMGDYYREWLASEQLLSLQGCSDAGRVFIHADKDQRTLETGRALAETLLPGCTVAVHSMQSGSHDPLFGSMEADTTKPDSNLGARAVQERLGNNANHFLDLHRAAFEALQAVLVAGPSPQKQIAPAQELSVTAAGNSVRISDFLSVGATLGEDFLLEYTNGMQGKGLGWGRLDVDRLTRILELHALSSDLMRRTDYLARAKGSNLLNHVLSSMQQAVNGKAVPGALGSPETTVLIVSGHDSNQANLSGMLGLSWHLAGYQPDDTPPGGALIFSLWQQPGTATYFVRTQYLAQSLQQMRDATPLSLATPPAEEDVAVPGCGHRGESFSCLWGAFEGIVQKAIDRRFVAN